ncbi:hypothetical protein SDC9_115394 [bioreactor metagenome]|uniref:ABM domain-containing protein n=1 Tax=bioreactor metagenome TaxID=1076179 RepID=A0A645BV17_9ZZZZ
MSNWIFVNVRYAIKPGKRNEFLEKLSNQGVIKNSKAEPGNIKYEYSIPIDSDNDLILTEMWTNSEALEAHGKSEHYQRLQVLKKEYTTDVTIEKFSISAKL